MCDSEQLSSFHCCLVFSGGEENTIPLGSGRQRRRAIVQFTVLNSALFLYVTLGDTVFLTPLEPGVDPYIGKITELIRIPIQPEGKDSGTEGAVEPGVIPEEPEGVERVTMPAQHLVTVKWYYRLQELELDGPLPVYENEIFASEDVATHPIAAVSGHCIVESPTSTIAFRPGVFVCSRKYIPQEG